MKSTVKQRLEYLRSKIDAGVEFPDAVFKTSEKFNLNLRQVKELEHAYDIDDANRNVRASI